MSETWLLWGLLYGSIGIGFLVYGRKQKSLVHFICGLALIGVPYLVASTTSLIIVGAGLTLAPFFIRI